MLGKKVAKFSPRILYIVISEISSIYETFQVFFTGFVNELIENDSQSLIDRACATYISS